MLQLSFLRKNGKSVWLTTTSLRLFCCQKEQWTDIPNFSRYLVSSSGKVKTQKNERLLSIDIPRFQKLNKPVQLQLTRDDGKRVNFYLGRLVLGSFKPTEESNKMYATHINGNMWDDTLDNLAWNDKIPHNWGKVYSSYVRLTSMSNNNVLEFHSILECT
eukprot:472449_1